MNPNISEFFEKIEASGFYRRGKINSQKIHDTRIDHLFEYVLLLENLTSSKDLNRINSPFIYSASLALTPGALYCASPPCRLRRAYELGRFASFYADRVYMYNYFSDVRGVDLSDERVRKVFYFQFIIDLVILMELRPLIEADLISIFTPAPYCPHCFVKESFGKGIDKLFIKQERKLRRQYLNEMSIKLKMTKPKKNLKTEIRGPRYLVDHGLDIDFSVIPPEIDEDKTLVKRLNNGEEIIISSRQRKELNIHGYLVDAILENTKYQLGAASSLVASIITNRKIDVDMLNALSGDPLIAQKNLIAEEYLTSSIPIIEGLSIKDLLKIRKREKEAFAIYRGALKNATEEYRKNRNILTKVTAKEIYSDIIAPKIAILERKMDDARKDLFKNVGRRLLALSGAISFGVVVGMIPREIISVASALGLTRIVAGILEDLMKEGEVKKEIREDQMYFLWKVQRLSNKKSGGSMDFKPEDYIE